MKKPLFNPVVDKVVGKSKTWNTEIALLRVIAFGCGLTEELKWGWPCYTVDKKNVVLIHAFKEYCALLFFKGALLKDPRKVLVQQTPNVQGPRQMRFRDAAEIRKMTAVIEKYIREAMQIEKEGMKLELKKTNEFPMPDEFRDRLEKSARLKKAFSALTPGRQRGYLLHFSSAKQSATRIARVEKYIPQILEGRGLDD